MNFDFERSRVDCISQILQILCFLVLVPGGVYCFGQLITSVKNYLRATFYFSIVFPCH